MITSRMWMTAALTAVVMSAGAASSFAQSAAEREEMKRRADAAYRDREFAQAIELLDEVLAAAPTDDVALYLRGSARVELGIAERDPALIRDGIADAREAIRHSSRSRIDYYLPYLYGMSNLAALEERESHLDTAIEVATNLLDMPRWTSRERANVYYQRGLMHAQQQDAEAALEDFEAAISRDSRHLAAHLARCDLLARTAGPEAAEAAFDRALNAFPDNPIVWNNRGMFFQSLGRTEDAIKDFSRALQADASFAPALTNRGYAHLESGRADRAIEDFNAALDISADQPHVLNLRGTAKLRLGELASALEDYEQATALDGGSPTAFADLGFARFFDGQYAAAIEAFRQARRLDEQARFLDGWIVASRLFAGERSQAESQYADVLNEPSADRDWFEMIVLFLLRQVSEDELLDAVATGDDALTDAQRCEAYYFIGLDHRLRGDDEQAELFFRQALQTGAHHLSAYRGAQYELDAFGRT